MDFIKNRNFNNLLVHHRWSWHLLFWAGYALFRLSVYYITLAHYPRIYLEYMLLSEIIFMGIIYFTIWLFKRLFRRRKYRSYFLLGCLSWVVYLFVKTLFQFWYLKNEPSFRNSNFQSIIISSLTFIIVTFLFITACKFFKDGYIAQHFEAEKKQQQLLAEVNNLKSQIAPHFLFNTLNNLYGLAVDKSDKLPQLMLRLSDLLRHSLYETQKPLVPIKEEMAVLKSYIDLESIRLEDSLDLKYENLVPLEANHQIAPLILIIFIENAFKHGKLVESQPVSIAVRATLQQDWFELIVKNNYNTRKKDSPHGIGLTNVKRRLEVLYPDDQHNLAIEKDEHYYTVCLRLKLIQKI